MSGGTERPVRWDWVPKILLAAGIGLTIVAIALNVMRLYESAMRVFLGAVAFFALVPVSVLRRAWREKVQSERRQRGHCPACGYDLRATSGRCPECGAVPGK